ncbi:DHHC zinc finger domain containing protein [Tritrichomonas foetus]|uniref:Palmitoyltransferase n=1 Tax=Tritrichomonas foetus TaxID=1144522 RepID=A0A1J4L2W8_9EUKA|nr:DHHC zinc finger domain containing protein [Tritrichomonas foetus]|eukprot:OHT17432.1 DHHC zinc finger domain containing protein [Tritrichomonas foetus]
MDITDLESKYNTKDTKQRPEETVFTSVCQCGPLHLWRLSQTKELVLNHYLIKSPIPIYVFFLVISNYFFFFHYIYPFGNWKFEFLRYLYLFIMIYSLIVYLIIFYEGPGYLPYYYPRRPKGKDDLSGFVTTEDQYYYVKSKHFPRHIQYFSSAGRLVIRADHFCAWTGSFIGKRNLKVFMQFVILILVYLGTMLPFETKIGVMIIKKTISFSYVDLAVYLFYYCQSCFLTFLTLKILVSTIAVNTVGMSSFEYYYQYIHRISLSTRLPAIDNWELVCGPRSQWYLWLLPIPAFWHLDDYELAEMVIRDNKRANDFRESMGELPFMYDGDSSLPFFKMSA